MPSTKQRQLTNVFFSEKTGEPCFSWSFKSIRLCLETLLFENILMATLIISVCIFIGGNLLSIYLIHWEELILPEQSFLK